MSTINDGGPAFPVFPETGNAHAAAFRGMSLRDHFAGLAMPAVYAQAMRDAEQGSGLFQDPSWRVGLALDAYAMADAMLRARAIPISN